MHIRTNSISAKTISAPSSSRRKAARRARKSRLARVGRGAMVMALSFKVAGPDAAPANTSFRHGVAQKLWQNCGKAGEGRACRGWGKRCRKGAGIVAPGRTAVLPQSCPTRPRIARIGQMRITDASNRVKTAFISAEICARAAIGAGAIRALPIESRSEEKKSHVCRWGTEFPRILSIRCSSARPR